jgi:DNA modification methylase
MPTIQFKGKSVIETYHHTVPHHRLEFVPELSVLPKGQKPSLDGNLIIEGDNLLALKALLPTHAGKVKCIYIDPPYNTGNEGWVYNDNLTQPQFKEWIGQTVGKEGEDATRHDKWCCMMYPRLRVLWELLREDGSIWVSIGEDEIHRLRELLDEAFGIENFIATIVWRNSTGPKQSNYLSTSHDYIACYAKKLTSWKRNLLPRTPEQEADYTNPDNDPRGPWRSGGLDARNYYSRGRYPIKCPGGRVIEGPPGDSYWRVPEDTLWELDADGRIWWGDDGNNVPRIKRFLSEVQQGLIPQTVWDYDEVGHTQEAKQEVLRILGSTDAPVTPKPVALVRRIIHIASSPGDIVLDSFAGTGTTAHAVLEENRDNAGDRCFVLVQNAQDTKDDISEKRNICETLTAERVRRVIKGYDYVKRGPKGKKTKAHEDALGGSFTYARVGEPLFGEYKNFGENLPTWEDLAKYIFYTETSRDIDLKKVNPETGFIGSTPAAGGTAYYLLYTANHKEDRELSIATLKTIFKKEKTRSLVIYCEKIWMHPEELRRMEQDQGVRVRPMLVPFNLR